MNRLLVLLIFALWLMPARAHAECSLDEPRLLGMQPGPYGNVNILYRAHVDAEDHGVTISGQARVFYYYADMTGNIQQSSTFVYVTARARRGDSHADILLNVTSPLGRIIRVDDVDFSFVSCD